MPNIDLTELNSSLLTWWKSDNGFGIDWRPPKCFAEHIDKIGRFPQLRNRIATRCQQLLDFGLFDIDRVDLNFHGGLQIKINPGNACYLSIGDDGIYTHNVDNSTQAFCLFLLCQTAMDEIYTFLRMLVEGKQLELEEPRDTTITLKVKDECRPLKAYVTKDDMLTPGKIFFAHTLREANARLSKIDPKAARAEPLWGETHHKLVVDVPQQAWNNANSRPIKWEDKK